ncbi:MAG: hypothetical protein AB7T63_16505 [Planctomycetota bacterium]
MDAPHAHRSPSSSGPPPRRWHDTLPLLGVLLAVALIGIVAWKRWQPVPLRERAAQLGDEDGDVVAVRLALEAPAEVAPGAPLEVTLLAENAGSLPLDDLTLALVTPEGTRVDAASTSVQWERLEPGSTGRHVVALAFDKAGIQELQAAVGDARGGARAEARARVEVKPAGVDRTRLAPVLEQALLLVTRGPKQVHDDAPFELTVVVQTLGAPLDDVQVDVEPGPDLELLGAEGRSRRLPRLEPERHAALTLRLLPRRGGRHQVQVLASSPDGAIRAVGVHVVRVGSS